MTIFHSVRSSEAGIVDVSLLYSQAEKCGVNLYINGVCVDRSMCWEKTGKLDLNTSEDKTPDGALWSCSLNGPYIVHRGEHLLYFFLSLEYDISHPFFLSYEFVPVHNFYSRRQSISI